MRQSISKLKFANFILLCNIMNFQRSCHGFLHHHFYLPFNYHHTSSIRRTLRHFSSMHIFSSPSMISSEDNTSRDPPQRTFEGMSNFTLPITKNRTQDSWNRRFSSAVGDNSHDADAAAFIVPKKISIPLDQVQISFSRSSGAGGQNVNKVETKAELRFHVMSAPWLPLEVRDRIFNNEANRINSDGYLALSSQEYRTQHQNRKAVISKLEEICLKAFPRPKVRKIRQGLTKKAKEHRREEKRFRSKTKESRKSVDF